MSIKGFLSMRIQQIFWRQWYDANSKMWSDVLGVTKNVHGPFGLYRQSWVVLRKFTPTGAASSRSGDGGGCRSWAQDLRDRDSLAGLAPSLRSMAEGVWKQMFEEGNLPTDPLDL